MCLNSVVADGADQVRGQCSHPWGEDTFSDFWAGFQPKMTTVPYIFLNFYDKFFESQRRQNLEILTEHKPAWNHVTRTPAKSQKQQRPLALPPAMVG